VRDIRIDEEPGLEYSDAPSQRLTGWSSEPATAASFCASSHELASSKLTKAFCSSLTNESFPFDLERKNGHGSANRIRLVCRAF